MHALLECEVREVKPQTFYNLMSGAVETAVATPGYPLQLPGLDGVEFAVVRPITWGGGLVTDRWQVIHVRSGNRIGSENLPTRRKAIMHAQDCLGANAREHGWPWVVRKAKRAKHSAILAALGR